MPKKSWKSSSLTFFFLLPFLFLYFAFGVYFLRARRSHLFSVCHWYWSCLIGDLYQLMSIFFSCTSRKPLRMKLFVCLPRRKLFAKKKFHFFHIFRIEITVSVCMLKMLHVPLKKRRSDIVHEWNIIRRWFLFVSNKFHLHIVNNLQLCRCNASLSIQLSQSDLSSVKLDNQLAKQLAWKIYKTATITILAF